MPARAPPSIPRLAGPAFAPGSTAPCAEAFLWIVLPDQLLLSMADFVCEIRERQGMLYEPPSLGIRRVATTPSASQPVKWKKSWLQETQEMCTPRFSKAATSFPAGLLWGEILACHENYQMDPA